MPNYRRAKTPGGTYFFTLVTYRRQQILCDEPIRQALRQAIRNTRLHYPFSVDAWVLMPDHLHCLWTLPDGDDDFSTRWSLNKTPGKYRLQGTLQAGAVENAVKGKAPRIDPVAAAFLGTLYTGST